MLANYLKQFFLIGLYCLVNSNPYLIQHNSYYRQNSPVSFYPDNYFVSQSRQTQSYAIPRSSNYQKRTIQQREKPYRMWTYQQNNLHRWNNNPANFYTTSANRQYNENQQVQSESFDRPIYRKQNHVKKLNNNAISYQKKYEFLESKKKKSQPACKASNEGK